MDKLVAFLNNVPGWMQTVGTICAIISLGVGAFMLMGGREHQQKAKSHLGYVLLAVGVLFMASALVATVKNAAA